ncbi:MAG: hypothetical protein EA404_06255 [Spirochaetaceae bacterium]|nr:MAG: hypothetical protein EA404_06255 [Spirochaetaceae bacterium]
MKHAINRATRLAARLAVTAAINLLLAGCYAPLADSGEGSIAMKVSLPGSILAQQSSESFVARIYVGNLAYEDLLRRFAAYDDFLEENYYYYVDNPSQMEELDSEVREQLLNVLVPYYQQVEATMDDLEEDVILKAATMFGGNPYYDVTFSVRLEDGVAVGGGSFTLPGIPAGREYVVFFDVYEPGDQDRDDADMVAYSRVWREADPYQELFRTGNGNGDDRGGGGIVVLDGPNPPEVEDARAALAAVRAAYADKRAYPVVSVLVESGKTATIAVDVVVD